MFAWRRRFFRGGEGRTAKCHARGTTRDCIIENVLKHNSCACVCVFIILLSRVIFPEDRAAVECGFQWSPALLRDINIIVIVLHAESIAFGGVVGRSPGDAKTTRPLRPDRPDARRPYGAEIGSFAAHGNVATAKTSEEKMFAVKVSRTVCPSLQRRLTNQGSG